MEPFPFSFNVSQAWVLWTQTFSQENLIFSPNSINRTALFFLFPFSLTFLTIRPRLVSYMNPIFPWFFKKIWFLKSVPGTGLVHFSRIFKFIVIPWSFSSLSPTVTFPPHKGSHYFYLYEVHHISMVNPTVGLWNLKPWLELHKCPTQATLRLRGRK